MKALFAAALALAILAGQADADPKMNRDTIVISTQNAAANGNWIGPALTIVVFLLAFGGGGVAPS